MSGLLGLVLLVAISTPFFRRRVVETPSSEIGASLEELKSLWNSNLSLIQTLELEFELGYIDEVDYQARIVTYHDTRERILFEFNQILSPLSSNDGENL